MWDAKERQISETSRVGDRVYVGYIADNDPHNYQIATVTRLHRVGCYPDGLDGEVEWHYQVWIRFADGQEICW